MRQRQCAGRTKLITKWRPFESRAVNSKGEQHAILRICSLITLFQILGQVMLGAVYAALLNPPEQIGADFCVNLVERLTKSADERMTSTEQKTTIGRLLQKLKKT
jgi:hypothetical protein